MFAKKNVKTIPLFTCQRSTLANPIIISPKFYFDSPTSFMVL